MALSGFYVHTERAPRLFDWQHKRCSLLRNLPKRIRASAWHCIFRFVSTKRLREYKRALELDPNSKRRGAVWPISNRALGKAEEALALYRQQLEAEPTDKAARTGLILSLLDLGRTDEAKAELEKALKTDPRNLHFAGRRGLLVCRAQRQRIGALASARQGSADRAAIYLVANRAGAGAWWRSENRWKRNARCVSRASMASFPRSIMSWRARCCPPDLYDEAAEVLMQSFSLKEGKIETRLAGQAVVRSAEFYRSAGAGTTREYFPVSCQPTRDQRKTA